MPSQNSNYWLLRAEDARAVAERMHDQFAKKSMMEIVAAYEKLAAYARSLERSNPPVDLQRPNRAVGDGDAGSE